MAQRILKYFDRETLRSVNRIAARRKYNRVLKVEFLRALPADAKFPVVFEMLHEHAQGKSVAPHMRCVVVFDQMGTQGQIDCPMDIYNSLPEYTTGE